MAEKLEFIMDSGLTQSQVMETEPIGMSGDQRWFLNLIVRASFAGTPQELLAECNRIERELGRNRTREKQLSARSADIDILLFGHVIIMEKSLIVPHPRFLERRFCLEGLRQIGARWKVPGTGITVGEHYERMPPHVRRQRIIFMNGKNHGMHQGKTR
jgi:2-amino-4-hydroxy-6-hydroxymethyldihydropteridine diphosphokinase